MIIYLKIITQQINLKADMEHGEKVQHVFAEFLKVKEKENEA